MRKNNCEVIRRELDELMLDEAYGASVAEHLEGCSACREFRDTRTKLRQIVGSLGTVAAPPDFDYRLRARLASDSSSAGFHLNSAYWPFARRGFAVAAVLIVFATGVVLVRNVVNKRSEVVVTTVNPEPPPKQQSPANSETSASNATPAPTKELTAGAQESDPRKIRNERSPRPGSRSQRSLTAVDFSSQRAEVVNGSETVASSGAPAVFPIDASLQPLRVSLDDGRGNAKTISVPTISFGSQRLPNGNQFAQKGVW
jgi:hypothetical protein